MVDFPGQGQCVCQTEPDRTRLIQQGPTSHDLLFKNTHRHHRRSRRDVAGIHREPPELTLRGSPGVRRSRAAI